MRVVIGVLSGIALLLPAAALACGGQVTSESVSASVMAFDESLPKACMLDEVQVARPSVKTVTVSDVVRLLRAAKKAQLVDANSEETRAKLGVIPGALLLTSATRFDPVRELPEAKDKPLVFYCANAQCKASQVAAERALANGFTDVSVLPAGVVGWKQSGQKTQSVLRS